MASPPSGIGSHWRGFSSEGKIRRGFRRIYGVAYVSSVAFAAAGLYHAYREDIIPYLPPVPLEQIDEKKFEGADDMVVVLLGTRRMSAYPRRQMERLKGILPEGIQLYYTVKEGVDNKKPPVMLYKGMRKHYYASTYLLDKSQCDDMKAEMEEFFKPQSQDYDNIQQYPNIPEYVTYDTFQEKVVKAATPKAPIVLQLYEESCFLCFLMRPFINSINRHLGEIKSNVRIKRLNIERNDFPKGCCVTRATPTFVVYDGQPNGTRWSEFKPQEFVNKMVELAKLDSKSQKYMEKLSEDVSRRFMMFGNWARLIAQAQAIQESVLTRRPVDREAVYSRAIQMLMEADMDQHDDLEQNLERLKGEINSAEKDCLSMAMIQAQEIIKANKQQQAKTAK